MAVSYDLGFSNIYRNNTEEDQGRYLVSAITSNMWAVGIQSGYKPR